ncbi:MAG TPA: DUF4824 family protein, partial [Aggregicoccus sp.]|nr:DUF4824 family protein [Aggregicoccus sp.]
FVVDAGRDAGQLRSRYPDRGRYAIVAGKVGASWRSPAGKPRLTGTVNGLLIPELTVPRDLRAVIESQERRPGEAPGHPVRFEATVAYGKRLEPWLASLGSR